MNRKETIIFKLNEIKSNPFVEKIQAEKIFTPLRPILFARDVIRGRSTVLAGYTAANFALRSAHRARHKLK